MRFFAFVFFALFVLCLGCHGSKQAPDASVVRAAAGICIINPPNGTSMGGYFASDRKSEGIHDDIYARCLMLEFSGKKRLVLVSLDLVGFLREDVLKIQQMFADDPAFSDQINPDPLFIFSTHQHSSPDTLGVFGGGRRETYIQELREKIFCLIKAVSGHLEPASLWFGRASGEGISLNWKVPEQLDSDIHILLARNSAGKNIATLVNFACHPESVTKQNHLITADFPGYLVKKIEKEKGGVALFANGLLGGMVSINRTYFHNSDKSFALAQEVGETIADRALQAVKTARPLADCKELSIAKSPVSICLENKQFRAMIERGQIPSSPRTYQNGNIQTEISVVAFGGIQMLMVPGEMTPGLGMKIKNLFQNRGEVMAIGLANDEIGYLLPQEDFYLPKYKQEREKSLGPTAGEKVYHAFEKLTAP